MHSRPPATKPTFYVLEHPTFGCFLDAYKELGGLPNIDMTLMREAHVLAKQHDSRRLPYTATVEAYWTVLLHTHTPPVRLDWKLWRHLDALGLTRTDMQARYLWLQTTMTDAGASVVGMIEPRYLQETFERQLSEDNPHSPYLQFLNPSEETVAAYSGIEHFGASHGYFTDSVVHGWLEANAPQRSWWRLSRILEQTPVPVSASR